MKFRDFFSFVVVTAVLLTFVAAAEEEFSEEAQELFDDYFSWRMRTNPEFASLRGFHDYDTRLSDYTIRQAVQREINCKSFKRRAESLLKGEDDDISLSDKERHAIKLLQHEAEICASGMRHKGYLFAPVNFKNGIQISLPTKFEEESFFAVVDDDDDDDETAYYDKVLKRLEIIPKQIDGIIETLKVAIAEGMTYAKESMTRVADQFDALQVVDPENSPFYEPFRRLDFVDGHLEKAVKDGYRDEARRVIASMVLPAFRNLSTFIQDEYMKHLRPAPGVWSLGPNGKDFYQACLEYHTTLKNVTPEEVHEIGMQSIEDLKDGVLDVAKNQLDLGNMSFSDVLDYIRNSEELRFQTKEEGLALFKSILHDKVNDKLDQFFKVENLQPEVFVVNIEVTPANSGSTAYYNGPSRDGSKNGTFYVNLNNLDVFQKTIATTLTLHETNPGHHLETVQQQYSGHPQFAEFRVHDKMEQVPSKPPVFTAFSEGWALYSEYLGHEMGVFDDPFQLMGFYSYNLLRSARLVVDTGIHHFEWTRQQAVDFLMENTAFSRQYVELQADRYITWPGQATSYRMGEKAIREIRERREQQQGASFNLKQFHADVLACKGPLYDLEECIERREESRGVDTDE